MPKTKSLSRTIVLLPLLAVASGKAPLSNWDSVQALMPGTQVRVVVDNAKPVSGALESVTGSTLVILRADAGRQPFEKTQIVSMSTKKSGHRGRNILIGAGAGLAVGAALGLLVGVNCSTCKPDRTTLGYSMGGFAFWGGVVGAVWRTGGWRTVYER